MFTKTTTPAVETTAVETTGTDLLALINLKAQYFTVLSTEDADFRALELDALMAANTTTWEDFQDYMSEIGVRVPENDHIVREPKLPAKAVAAVAEEIREIRDYRVAKKLLRSQMVAGVRSLRDRQGVS